MGRKEGRKNSLSKLLLQLEDGIHQLKGGHSKDIYQLVFLYLNLILFTDRWTQLSWVFQGGQRGPRPFDALQIDHHRRMAGLGMATIWSREGVIPGRVQSCQVERTRP